VTPFYLGNPQIGQATEANLCALDQDKYFEYRKAIFENIDQMQSLDGLKIIASKVEGLDTEAIASCVSAGTYHAMLQEGLGVASEQGVSSTPTFFVNGQKIEGNRPDVIIQAIKRGLDKGS
jgi:protein-disulfide isomerase